VIDVHTHILPRLDDGAATLEQSVEMARAAVAEGITTVVATPHVRDDYPTTAAEMEEAVTELRLAVAADGLTLEILTGGEIALDRLETLADEELHRFALGFGSYVLLECPYLGWPLNLEHAARELRRRGFGVILAHPERNSDATPQRVASLVDDGVLVQVTSASLDGRLGRTARAAALALVEGGLAHVVASDAHAPDLRAVGMKAAMDALGDQALAAWLTFAVPRAIVTGAHLPQRPAPRRRRRRLFGR
jgi:protein-tyrosine phosphatase